MNNLELLAAALEYVELHLRDELRTEEVARACFCSKSTLEKLFRCVNHISVRDYMVRRRMTLAAKALVEQPKSSILEIAVMYGYSSHEAFTRAFTQVWNCSPSKYREKSRSVELFPRLDSTLETGEYIMAHRNFDISEMYDLFQKRRDCYFVCCDICNLIPINAISHKAGDLAILESMKRMEEVADDEDIIFRIGGDEFAMLTNSTEEAYALSIASKILSKNGECFTYEDKQIPLNLYVGTIKLGDKMMRYQELFDELQQTIQMEKKKADAMKEAAKK